MDSKTLIDKHRRFLFPAVANFYADPLVMDQASGCRVRDLAGRSYLDFFGGILTVSLGHCEPRITARVKAQVDRLQHASTLYPTAPIVELAETLARITPGALSQSFFTNSGTEANETALMLARLHTGHHDIIALRHSYSGRSQVCANLTGQAGWRPLASVTSGIKHAHSAYCYRCAFGATYPACDLRCARDIEELIATETNGRVAALLAEPIQGAGGFIVPPPEYFKIVVEIVRRHGGLFICDEVQTGFGRTGDHLFGIEHWGVLPEVMTMAKGIANGFPLGATLATPEVAASFKALTISTFGGNPVSTTAAQATIEVIEADGVPARAARLGRRLREGLMALAERFPLIGDVRGMGLMQALELVADRKTKEPAPKKVAELLEATRRHGLLIGKGGAYGNVVRISPPMLIDEAEVDEALELLGRALAEVSP